MDARFFSTAARAATRSRCFPLLALLALLFCSMGASARSRNFIVQTHDPALAKQIAETAERYRHDLAISWLGKAMPDWYAPCVMNVRVAPGLGAGGQTTFMFDQGEVFGWRMDIQGSRQRVLDSVLPHEITHMILASHFRRPLPRWADEGAATSTECAEERAKHYRMLKQFLCSRRGIAFGQMFAMTEYPPDVMPLYAQGFTLVDYLVQQGGRRKFLAFLGDAMQTNQWSATLRRHYGSANVAQLQDNWLDWIKQGHPRLQPAPTAPGDLGPDTMLASATGQPSQWSPSASNPVRPAAHLAGQTVGAGRRTRPEPNLIHHVPRGTKPVQTTLASAGQFRPGSTSLGTVDDSRELVPVVLPERRNTAVAATAPAGTSHMARPQPIEPARQIVIEWVKPTLPASPARAGPVCSAPAGGTPVQTVPSCPSPGYTGLTCSPPGCTGPTCSGPACSGPACSGPACSGPMCGTPRRLW